MEGGPSAPETSAIRIFVPMPVLRKTKVWLFCCSGGWWSVERRATTLFCGFSFHICWEKCLCPFWLPWRDLALKWWHGDVFLLVLRRERWYTHTRGRAGSRGPSRTNHRRSHEVSRGIAWPGFVLVIKLRDRLYYPDQTDPNGLMVSMLLLRSLTEETYM